MDRVTVCTDGGHRWRKEAWRSLLWSIVVAVVLGGCSTPSRVDDSADESAHQVFHLTNISAERGQTILSELGLGEASAGPEPNSLFVCGSPEDLQRAGIVLALVDVNEPCVVQSVALAAEVRALPSNDQIAESIGDIRIGMFSKPPKRGDGAQAIIDIHGDSVWAIVPARLWPDVRAVVESGGKAIRQRTETEHRVEPDSSRASTTPRQRPQSATLERDTLRPSPIVENRAAPQMLPKPPLGDAADVSTDAQREPSVQPGAAVEAIPPPESPVVGRAIVSHRPARNPTQEPAGESVTGTLVHLNGGGTRGLRRLQVPLDNGDDILELTLPEKINLVQFTDLQHIDVSSADQPA